MRKRNMFSKFHFTKDTIKTCLECATIGIGLINFHYINIYNFSPAGELSDVIGGKKTPAEGWNNTINPNKHAEELKFKVQSDIDKNNKKIADEVILKLKKGPTKI